MAGVTALSGTKKEAKSPVSSKRVQAPQEGTSSEEQARRNNLYVELFPHSNQEGTLSTKQATASKGFFEKILEKGELIFKKILIL